MAGILERRKAPPVVLGDATAPEGAAPARVIVASARRIDLADRKATVKALGKRLSWQDDCWLVFHSIGEVKYADRFLANICSRCRLYPAVRPDPDQPPIAVRDSTLPETVVAAAEDALRRIKAERGGQAAIVQGIALGLEVAGECYLLGYEEVAEVLGPDRQVVTPARAERWEVRSTSEIQVTQEGVVQTRDTPNGKWEDVPEGTFFLRIWEPDPQWSNQPDSPLRGVLAEADELLILSRAIRAAGRSRMPAGLLLVPSELSFGPVDKTAGTADDDQDPFSDALMEAMTRAVEDEGDPAALVPPVVRGKADHLKELRHVTLDRKIDAIQAEQRKELLRRLAQGLNVPPEVVTGMADLNHWTAWQVDGATFAAHAEPRLLGIVDALTTGAFSSVFAAYEGVGPEHVEQVFLWYDESEVVTTPNRGQDAKDAHESLVISDEALRSALGFSDADAPDDEELGRRVGLRRGIMDGPITETLLALVLGPAFVDRVEAIRADQKQTEVAIEAEAEAAAAGDETAQPGPPANNGETPPQDAIAAAGARPNVGARLARIDADLFARLRVAADAALQRTMERAGARLRSRAPAGPTREAITTVDNADVAATLGPAVVATLATEEELLAGAFDGLQARWETWVEGAQEQALAVAENEWGLTDTSRLADLRGRMRADRDEAWSWFSGAILDLARDRLYGRGAMAAAATRTTAALIGEADPALTMPASTIREALARAGGGAGLEVTRTSAGGVQVRTQAGRIPAGGVATGQTMLAVAEDEGMTVEWYTWRHGSPPRPFPPHAALDGVNFYGTDDPNVAADGGWPYVAFYEPGDHDGCTCMAEPFLSERRSTADLIG